MVKLDIMNLRSVESSKKPQIPTTKIFSSLRREKLFGSLNLPGKTKETRFILPVQTNQW